MEACPAGTHFSLVSLTQDDVRCHDWLSCMFLTAWGDVFVTSLVLRWVDFLDLLYSLDLLCGYTFIGLACRPADIVLPLFWSLFRGTPILAGGIGVARGCGLAVFAVFVFCLWAIFTSVLLLVTRLG